MIVFAELQMQGEKHVNVNCGLLEILSKSFPLLPIKIVCDEIQKKEIENKITSLSNIEFETFNYTGDKELKKIFIINKILREVKLAYSIFRSANKNNVDKILFASAFPFTAVFLNIFAKIFKKNIIVCLHGDIGVLTLKDNKFSIKIFRYIITWFLKNRNSNVGLLIYGESIKNKLFSLYPDYNQKNIIAIDHPYVYNAEKDISVIKRPVVISCIGTGLINKNSHFIYDLAFLCKDEVEAGKIEFHQIGNVNAKVLNYSNDYVKYLQSDGFMSMDVFEKAISESNYFIYFFTENSYYDLCPSGTFFDAIKYQTPIIALHNPFFDYYFEKLGNIGYLCDSLDEMVEIVKNISSLNNKSQFEEQVTNLVKAKATLSVDNSIVCFTDQYNKLFQ